MADTPTWFPDVWEEIGLVRRLNTAQAQYRQRFGALNRTDPRTGQNGLVLLNKIARVGPQMAPYAIPLAAAGVDPDTNPLPAYVLQQDARKRLDELGMVPFAGLARPLANDGSSNPRYRLQNALEAANVVGLIDRNGVLHEPDATDMTDPQRFAFEDIRGAAMGAGVNLPYTDRFGEERQLRWGPKPPGLVSVEGRQAHRRYEAAYEPFVEIQAQAQSSGLYKLDQLTSDPLLREAGKKFTNELGYLVSPKADDPEFEDFLNTLSRSSSFEPGYLSSDGKSAFRWRNGASFNIPGLSVAPPDTGGQSSLGASAVEGMRNRAESLLGTKASADQGALTGPLSIASASPLDVTYEGARQTIQGLGIAANAPIQEATGYVRNVYSALTGQGKPDWRLNQSDLAVMLQDPDLDPGSGFFVNPESEVARQRNENEARRGQIGGHNVTLGRWAAIGAGIEPGESGFDLASGLVDFGWQIYGDPTTYLLSGAAKIRAGRQIFQPELDAQESVGAYHTFTRWLHGPTARQALNSRWGDGIVSRLASLSSPSDIMRQLNYRIDPNLAVSLADESDPNNIKNLLLPHLGTTFRSKSEVWRPWAERLNEFADFPSQSFNINRSGRYSAIVPENEVDVLNKRAGFRTLESYGKVGRMPQDRLNHFTDAFLRARSVEEAEDAVGDFMGAVDGILARNGVTNPQTRNGLVQRYIQDRRQMRMWMNDDVSSSTQMMDGMVIGDEFLHTGTGTPGSPSPHEILRSTDGKIELLDFRTFRRLTSNPALRILTTQHSIYNTSKMTGHLRWPILGMQYLQDALWKPVTLARAAWFVRVVGEEQLRIAATMNMDSAFSHPLSYIAYLMGAGGTDVNGNPFKTVQQFREAMFSRRGLLDDMPYKVRSSTRTMVYAKSSASYDVGYRNSWADAIVRLHQDPVTRYLSNHTIDDTVSFLAGEGRIIRDNLASITGVDLANEQLLRVYLQRASNNISALTGNNKDLINVISTGQFRTSSGIKPLFRKATFRQSEVDTTVMKSGFIDYRFRNKLDGYVDEYGPNELVGDITDFGDEGPFYRLEAGRRRAVDWMMANLMGKETNFLSRSPYFRQSYWSRMAELAPYIKGADREALLARFAEQSELLRVKGIQEQKFIPNRVRRKFEYELRQHTDDSATLTIDEADLLAKDFALQSTRDKLFDLSKKTSWEDSLGIISPFISAWKELFQSWGKIIAENPASLRRAQQLADGAIRSGVFYKDEQSGDLVFTYPGSEFVTKRLLGVPIPLTGRAEGLNFMAQVVPGIGPALQIPVTALMANKPQYRDLYEALVPFGSAAEQGLGEGFDPLNYAPPYIKRFLQSFSAATGGEGGTLFYNSPQDIRTYSNTVGQVARYLASTGEYDLEREEEWQRLLDDARSKAWRFYAVRAMASYFAPSAPAPRWLSETSSGDLIPIAVLTEEYRQLQNENFATADDTFLAKYGDEVVLSMTPFSKTLSWGLDPSKEFYDWTLDHAQLKRDYPSTYGLWGPTGKFDIGAFSAQFQGTNPDREQLSIEEWKNFAQHMIASRIYESERNFAGDEINSPEWQDYLSNLRSELRRQYPGFQNARGLPGGVEVDAAIAEIERAADDPTLADNPIMPALHSYLAERQAGLDDLANAGLRGFKSERAASWRQYLQSVAYDLSLQVPEFERMYDMVFSRELEPYDNG